MSAPDVWTIRRVLAWAADDLRSRGNDTPRLDAELLLGHVLGVSRIGLITDSERPLAKEELAAYRELHKRRRAGEPVAYMLGVREFYGRPFRVDRRVLVPRPDTETLVTVALERSKGRELDARVLDLCTGSGCVAITLAKERPTWRVIGTDVSLDALDVARDNAQRLGALPAVWFEEADVFEGLTDPGPYDVISGNPPYIAEHERAELAPTIVDFEPHVALFGGVDGLDLVRRIVRQSPAHLADGGLLALEIGAGQSAQVAQIFEEAGFTDVERARDYGGIERVVSGVRRHPPR